MDGIDYYPKRERKSNNQSKAKLGVVIFAFIAIVFYYFSNAKTLETPKANLIVIKEPELEKSKVVDTPVNVEVSGKQATPKKTEILENLDEIIQIR